LINILVTTYWNYTGDNGGMFLNPQKFQTSMPSVFGPGDCHVVLKSIFDSCIKCSFQSASFINRILDLFHSSSDNKKNLLTQIKGRLKLSFFSNFYHMFVFSFESVAKNSTIVNIPYFESQDEFWDVIRIFQNGISAGNDLFASTPPSVINRSE
jgi:hypothetical protein